jgi:hypothetical protein
MTGADLSEARDKLRDVNYLLVVAINRLGDVWGDQLEAEMFIRQAHEELKTARTLLARKKASNAKPTRKLTTKAS